MSFGGQFRTLRSEGGKKSCVHFELFILFCVVGDCLHLAVRNGKTG